MIVAIKTVVLKNGRKVELKSPAPEDAKNFLNHLVTTHTESYRNLDRYAKSWEQVPVEKESSIIHAFEMSANHFFIVALFEERIVGGLGIMGDEKDFQRRNATLGMSIQNAFSGIGLGTELLKYALEQAKKLEFHRLELRVRTYNTQAITLYEKVGFERVGLLKESAFVDDTFVDEFIYQLII
jgi:RimJ/RimL family protein N-acetyltransferase